MPHPMLESIDEGKHRHTLTRELKEAHNTMSHDDLRSQDARKFSVVNVGVGGARRTSTFRTSLVNPVDDDL